VTAQLGAIALLLFGQGVFESTSKLELLGLLLLPLDITAAKIHLVGRNERPRGESNRIAGRNIRSDAAGTHVDFIEVPFHTLNVVSDLGFGSIPLKIAPLPLEFSSGYCVSPLSVALEEALLLIGGRISTKET